MSSYWKVIESPLHGRNLSLPKAPPTIPEFRDTFGTSVVYTSISNPFKRTRITQSIPKKPLSQFPISNKIQPKKSNIMSDDGNNIKNHECDDNHSNSVDQKQLDEILLRLEGIKLDRSTPKVYVSAPKIRRKECAYVGPNISNLEKADLFESLFDDTVIPPPESVKPLTKEEDEHVNALLRKGQRGLIAELKTAMVSFNDIYKLEPQVWLNDEIINFYMEMLSDRSKANPKEYLDIHCFNTFFFSTLSESGYQKVRRWTKRIDIFSKDLVFAPINQSLHWTLGVIDIKNKKVYVYDSLGGAHQRGLKLLLDYVEQEHLDKKKDTLDMSEWTSSAPKDIPHQENMSDCGVFTCTFAERLSRNHEMDFSQKDMNLIRRRMVLDISRKHIS